MQTRTHRRLTALTVARRLKLSLSFAMSVGHLFTVVRHPRYRIRLQVERPRFSWTRIKGESNVQGGGENGSVEGRGTGRGIGATGVRADDAAAGAGSLAPGQRWSASRKRDVVLRLLRGESLEALYARRARAHHRVGAVPARRGPRPRQSDAQLLATIRADLARSPFHGEGHRKVHARLRILDGIRVARTRVLRVMRAHGLLSPHRGRQGTAKTHDGRVITQAPNVMWGTDGVRVFTLDDGWGWIFAAVEHWNAECMGWHVCKVGSRFAALDPIAQGLERLYGSLDADVARGLALRMDHGSQYLSDHFLKQIRSWGIHPRSVQELDQSRQAP